MKTEQQKSLFEILKTTIIFGSTQVFQMIIMLLRSKLSAVLLGPMGVGILSVFQTTLTTVGQFASMGIIQSGVREISQYNISGKEEELVNTIVIFRKLTNVLALFSFILMIGLSYPLTYIFFNTNDYFFAFSILSIGVFFYLLSQRQLTIMQATGQTKQIAYSSLIAAILGLLISWFLFANFGIKGIVLSVVLTFLFQFLVGSFMIKNETSQLGISTREALKKGKSMFSLGLVLMVSVLLINLFTLFLNAIISKYGNILDLGFFYSAFAITNGNILILISVLSSDYFPRLSALNNDFVKIKSLMNSQAELMCLITAPIAVFLITFSEFVVTTLLSKEFLIIIPMLKLMSIGLLFRIVWQSLSYVILAKGDRKVYLIYDALVGNGFVFLANLGFYFLFGLDGLGYSFVISSVVVSIVLTFAVYKNYKVHFDNKFIKSFLFSLMICIVAYFLAFFNETLLSVGVLFFSIVYAAIVISNRIGVDVFQFLKLKIEKYKC